MHYRYYRPYPYYRRYYNLDPYYYRRYYNPYYNIIDSQVADIDQSINNFGDMTDVYQDADIYQLRTPAQITEEPTPVPSEPVSQWRNPPEQLLPGESSETTED